MMTLSQQGLKINKKEALDERLKKIAGGNYAEDFYYAVSKFGNNYKLIKNAIDTNICPICSKQIIPDLEKCEATDFFAHLRSAHPNL